MRLKKYTEENGARAAVLKQAVYYPKEGLDYEAFLKVLLPHNRLLAVSSCRKDSLCALRRVILCFLQS